jgi:hypothetical protein
MEFQKDGKPVSLPIELSEEPGPQLRPGEPLVDPARQVLAEAIREAGKLRTENQTLRTLLYTENQTLRTLLYNAGEAATRLDIELQRVLRENNEIKRSFFFRLKERVIKAVAARIERAEDAR